MTNAISSVAESVLSCTAALTLILLMRKPMTRRFGAQVTYALWALVPLASLATLLPARSTMVVVNAAPRIANDVASGLGDANAQVLSSPGMVGSFDAAYWLVSLWVAGVVATLLLFLVQHRRFVRGLGRLEPMRGDLLRAQATQGCPALVGVWRPRIVVPADFEVRYTASERELILAHERCHRMRGDALLNALGTALRSVFWFNPLVHVAAPCFLADQELACDAAVMTRFPKSRRLYANAMMKAQLGDSRAAWACTWRPRNLLRERIALLARPLPDTSRRRLGRSAAVAVIFLGSLTAWASQPLETHVRYIEAEAVDPATNVVIDEHQPATPARGFAPRESTSGMVSAIASATSGVAGAMSVRDPHPMRAKSQPVAIASSGNGADASPTLMSRSTATSPQRGSTRATLENSLIDAAAVDGPANPAIQTPIAEARVREVSIDEDQAPREIPSYRRDHAPKYPAAAVRAHIEGKVVLDVQIDANGLPIGARIASLDPSSASELASASLAAVTQWQFEPARRAGTRVEGRIAVPFVFALVGDDPYAATESRRQASYRTIGASDYPQAIAGVEGVVYVRARIEDDGSVSSSEIDRVDPPSATSLVAPALAALKMWAFNPARDRGEPIASTVVVPIVFAPNAQSQPAIARIRNGLDPIRITPKHA